MVAMGTETVRMETVPLSDRIMRSGGITQVILNISFN
jgi:hypothetical protein